MRLNEKYIKVIEKYFFEIFNHGEIYLFGSRADDSKKGRDIDLYMDKERLVEKEVRHWGIKL